MQYRSAVYGSYKKEMFIQIIEHFPLIFDLIDYSGRRLPLFELVESVNIKSLQVISRLLGNNTRLFKCYNHLPTKPSPLLAMVMHCTIQVDILFHPECLLPTRWRGIRYGSLRDTSIQQAEGKKTSGCILCVFTGPVASRPL